MSQGTRTVAECEIEFRVVKFLGNGVPCIMHDPVSQMISRVESLTVIPLGKAMLFEMMRKVLDEMIVET